MTARQAARVVGALCVNCKHEPCACTVEVTRREPTAAHGAPPVNAATAQGWPCVTCKREPCTCIGEIIDRGVHERTPRRRYRFPDGSLFHLDEFHGARAVAAGAVLEERG